MSFNILPESATAPPAARRRYVWRTTLSGVMVAACMSAINTARSGELLDMALFAFLTLALCVGAYEFFQLLRALDEMQRRIHIGALALSGAMTAGLATLWGLAALAFPVTAPMIVFVGPAFGFGYYVALMLVVRHYT